MWRTLDFADQCLDSAYPVRWIDNALESRKERRKSSSIDFSYVADGPFLTAARMPAWGIAGSRNPRISPNAQHNAARADSTHGQLNFAG